jgi:alkylation response protein AidB-like acyl-CoA dehydrogenase
MMGGICTRLVAAGSNTVEDWSIPGRAEPDTRGVVSPDELVARARALAPRLRELQERTEADRRVPRESFEALLDADLYRTLMPKRHGGFEHELDAYVNVAFEIARGCGSTGWVHAITSTYQMLVAMYPLEAQDEVWGNNPRAVSAAAFAPAGELVPVDGGYRLGGKWMFCSGVDNCDWVIVGSRIMAGENAGPADRGFALVPKADFAIEDNWHVVGLAGTGSKNISCTDVFIPAYRFISVDDAGSGRPPGTLVNPAALYTIPMFTVISISVCAAIMGMAQGAYDEFVGGIRERITRGASVTKAAPMAEIPAVQLRVGEARASIDAARALIDKDCKELMATVSAGEELGVEQRGRFKGDQAFAARLATEAVDLLFKGGGGGGLFTQSRMQRYWRDINAGAMHITMNWDAIGAFSGRIALGLPPEAEQF